MNYPKTCRRPCLVPPSAGLIKGDIASALASASASIGGIAAPPQLLLEAVEQGKFPQLLHPLSVHLGSSAPTSPSRAHEARTLTAFFERHGTDTRDSGQLLELLCKANALLAEGTGEVRRHEVGLNINQTGIRVLFPKATKVPDQVKRVHKYLAEAKSPLLGAIVALAMLLNCHMFEDGNGRVARAYYSHILVRAGAGAHFPLHLFFNPTRRAFDLTLREAEVRGDWRPFILHNCRLIEVTARWLGSDRGFKHEAVAALEVS